MTSFKLVTLKSRGIDQIQHKIRITYKLYSLRENGSILNHVGSDEDIDKLIEKHNKWLGNKPYLIRKFVSESIEEPIFKVVPLKIKRIKKTKRRKK